MHDWTIETVLIDWIKGTIAITFKNNYSKEVQLTAENFADLRIPKREEWGESVSVNEAEGPTLLKNGNYHICIEIQSGDKIEIEAKSIWLPKC